MSKQRLTLRIGRNTLSFSLPDPDNAEQPIIYEPYVVKSGVSMAANLRDAFQTAELLEEPPSRANVLIDSPVLMTPVELFDEANMGLEYGHAYPDYAQDVILYNVLPDLNAVAVFSINKDLRLVLNDHFDDVRFISAVSPVWHHLHQRSYTGVHQKLYGYFHDQRLEVFCFRQNRFRFCNSFEARRFHDAQFFLLYVWNQLTLQTEYDELHIVGDIPDQEALLNELHQFVQKVYVINPVADFNRAPATQIKGMPYDLMTYYVKGR